MPVIVFDLDGTLLYTLEDLAASTNYALRAMHYPTRTLEEVRQFVGNGVGKLIRRAVPEDCGEEAYQRTFALFKAHYVEHCQDTTRLYPGIDEMLHALKALGVRMAIVSNKLQKGVDELYERWFSDTIEIAVGEREGIRRKPAPDMVLYALKALGAKREETIYVGDSDVDIATARAAGLRCVSVLWGFRDKAFLLQSGATTLIERPEELLQRFN